MSRSAISRLIPIAGWLSDCTPKTVRADVVAGIALAGLLVPEGWLMRASREFRRRWACMPR